VPESQIQLIFAEIKKVRYVQKKCPACGSNMTKKNGVRGGKQLYKCQKCGHQFRQRSGPTDEKLWQMVSKMFEPETYDNDESLCNRVSDAFKQLMESLEGLNHSLQHASSDSYEQFHGICTVQGAAMKADRDYEAWRVDNLRDEGAMEELEDKRQMVFYELFKSDFLRFDHCCKQKQQNTHHFEFNYDALPIEAVNCPATNSFCVCMDRYLKTPSAKTTELKIDKLGKYLFEHFMKLTMEDHYALTYFEEMLNLVQEDMKMLGKKAQDDKFISSTREIFTPEGLKLLKIAQEEGWLDDDFKPVGLSNTQCAVLADAIGFRLKLKNRWKPFNLLWGKKYLRHEFDNALNQPKTIAFSDLVEEKLGKE